MPPSFKSRLGTAVAGSTTLALLALGTFATQPLATTQPVVTAAGPVRSPASSVRMVSDGVRVNRALAIVATAPTRITLGEEIVVRGTVKVRAGAAARSRAVRLSEKVGTGTTLLAKTFSTRKGAFVFRVPAGFKVTTRTLVVSAPKAGVLAAARTRLSVKVVRAFVAPPGTDPAPTEPEPTPEIPTSGYDAPEPVDTTLPTPLGASTDWTYLFNGGGRWNPCEVIDWGYNPEGGYAGSLEDMKRAFAKISGYTGLKFRYQGLTGDDFNITWSNETEDPQLAGWTVGYAGSWGSGTDGADVAYRLHSGFMVLDEEHTLRPGYDSTGSATWGQVILHETLHALGLGHAAGQEQVMYGAVTSVNHLFGAGDVMGMTTIGAEQGCL